MTVPAAGDFRTPARKARSRPRLSAIKGAVAVLVVTACTDGSRNRSAGPPEGGVAAWAPVAAGWADFGGGPDHSRHAASETAISPASVARLAQARVFEAPGVTGTPAIVDGIVYFADWMGGVYAQRLDDGAPVWKRDIGVGVVSSPLVTRGRVYLSDRKNGVHALSRDDGAEIWTERIDASPHTELWSSPILADDVLVVGVAGRGTQQGGVPLPVSDLEAFRGAVVGLDAETGKLLWRVETTIDDDGTEYGSGASVWSSAAFDPGLSLVFIGTGNCYFQPASRFSDSLLAIDVKTGKRRWHYQFTEGDGFRSGAGGGPDFDVGAAPNLFEVDGKHLVGVGDKSGHYYALDRETGGLVWQKQLTQGSSLGGVMAPAAVADGVVYVVSNQTATQSRVFALSTRDGSTLWAQQVPTMTFGAPALAGGVLFVGPSDGVIYALDAKSGQRLWQDALPYGRGGGFSVAEGHLLTGYGYHFFNDALDPVPGGLAVYALGTRPRDGGVSADASRPPRDRLSDTGLYTDLGNGTLAPDVRPYEPRFELWSDGAAKARWIHLPQGAKIDTSDPDAWQLPVGTKLWKEFSRDGVRVETRLIERVSANEWFFMPYQWLPDQSEALAVAGGVKDASGTLHDIPSQADCTVCHNGTPNHVLGIGAIQLGHTLGGVTLSTLTTEGLLSAPVPAPSLPGSAAAVAALGYLHANCGFCHNSASPQFVTVAMDLGLKLASLGSVTSTPVFLTAVGKPPVAAPSGSTSSRIEPGSPDLSTIVFRMGLRGEIGQMPPLASELVDTTGLDTIRAFIASLPSAADAGADSGP